MAGTHLCTKIPWMVIFNVRNIETRFLMAQHPMHITSGNVQLKHDWSCRGSIPVPLTCKASALPFELHPLECVCFVIMKQPSFCCVFIWCLLRHLLDTAIGVLFVAKVDCGDAGHRSPYLSHAKRALYHLS